MSCFVDMKKIAILGSGWLGLPLAKELSKSFEIKLSTRSKIKLEKLNFKSIKPYLIDIDELKNVDEFLNVEILIINITSKNIDSFENFSKILENSCIKNIIYISTTSVYKLCNSYVKEEDSQNYSNSEFLKIEKALLDSNKNITILRFGGLIGYDRNLVKFFQNKPVINSKAPVNMLHRDDAIEIIKYIILKNEFGDIFNCCSSSHPTKKDFYTHCANVSDYNLPQFDEKLYDYKIVDNRKLKDKTGYKYIYDDLLEVRF
jgi:nucleoside-diphosphate-sugar epimerase